MTRLARAVVVMAVMVLCAGGAVLYFWASSGNPMSRAWDASRTGFEPIRMPFLLSTGSATVPIVDDTGKQIGALNGLVVAQWDNIQTAWVAAPADGSTWGRVDRSALRFALPENQSDIEVWACHWGKTRINSMFGPDVRSSFGRGKEGEIVLRVVSSDGLARETRYRITDDGRVDPVEFLATNEKSLGLSDMLRMLGVVATGVIGGWLCSLFLPRPRARVAV